MSSNSTGIPLYRFAVKCFLPTMFPLSRSCHLTARLDFIFADHSVVASTTHSNIFSFFQSLHGFKADPVSTRVKNIFYFERKVANEHDRHIHAL